MNIMINSKPYQVNDDCSLITVLDMLQIKNQFGVAIAVNNAVVSKVEWEKYLIKDKDNILIINAIFGG
jgi:sulfur carrier protein